MQTILRCRLILIIMTPHSLNMAVLLSQVGKAPKFLLHEYMSQ